MRAPVEEPLDGYRRGEDLPRKTKFPSTIRTENEIVEFLRERERERERERGLSYLVHKTYYLSS